MIHVCLLIAILLLAVFNIILIVNAIVKTKAIIRYIKSTSDIHKKVNNLIDDMAYLDDVISKSHESDMRVQQYTIWRLEEEIQTLKKHIMEEEKDAKK